MSRIFDIALFAGASQAVLATVIGIAILLLLIIRFKTNAFISLIAVAIFTGLAAGLAPEAAFKSVKNGMGGTLGFIAPVIGLGAIFGAILERSNVLSALAQKVIRVKKEGTKTMATGFMGLVAATPVFFDVALIVLMPLIKKMAAAANKVPLFFGLPLCAGLAIGHAFIPPTPGPILIASEIGANIGNVILIGAFVSVITLIVAGPIFTTWLDRRGALPGTIPSLSAHTDAPLDRQVRFGTALCLILFPIVLILLANVSKEFFPNNPVDNILQVIGHPFSALILACLVSWLWVGPKTADDKESFSKAIARSLEPTALIILVTGAGGAFKQVLTDSGAGHDLSAIISGLGLSMILTAYCLALLFRLLQGSATVAMVTAAGLLAAMIDPANYSSWQLAILTIAIAAGASGFSHVNDSGFWLVNRLFDLTEKETLRTWTLMTGILSISALILCLIIYPLAG